MFTILVVEDSRTQRQLIANLLISQGFAVTTARDGLEALARVETAPPDLVILDVVMPHLNGFEVCRRFKANPLTRAMPVLFCSSNATEVDRYWGLKQGAIAYLGKPFHPQDLIRTVNQVLQSPSPDPKIVPALELRQRQDC